MRAHFLINTTVACIVVCLGSGCNSEPGVTITFDAFVNGEPLQYGKKYPAPNGDGTYSITDFMFYVSNIRLIGAGDGDYIEKESYHLVKFRNGKGHTLVPDSVEAGSFDKLTFSIGIDSAANLSGVPRGDLDPTDQMAWNWTAGYKFILLEGKYYPAAGGSIPLVYHIGFNESKRDVVFEMPESGPIHLKVEIGKFFTSPNPIDFHTFPEILFNKEHAAMLAENYAEGFVTIR